MPEKEWYPNIVHSPAEQRELDKAKTAAEREQIRRGFVVSAEERRLAAAEKDKERAAREKPARTFFPRGGGAVGGGGGRPGVSPSADELIKFKTGGLVRRGYGKARGA